MHHLLLRLIMRLIVIKMVYFGIQIDTPINEIKIENRNTPTHIWLNDFQQQSSLLIGEYFNREKNSLFTKGDGIIAHPPEIK